MSESYIEANGIRLAYEEFGSPSAPAILLIMGLGTQMISWPLSLCNGLAAIMAGSSRVKLLKTITVPTLVIHGRDDALVPLECGIDTARHIPDARLQIIDGMGHNLPDALMPRLLELIAGHVGQDGVAFSLPANSDDIIRTSKGL